MTTNSIVPPADARRVFAWEQFDAASWARWFDGTTRTPGPATVTITGRQLDDGNVIRGVALALGNDELLDADEAPSLAAVLVEAAGKLNSHDCGTVTTLC